VGRDRLGRQLNLHRLLSDVFGGLLGLVGVSVLGNRGGGPAEEEGAQTKGA